MVCPLQRKSLFNTKVTAQSHLRQEHMTETPLEDKALAIPMLKSKSDTASAAVSTPPLSMRHDKSLPVMQLQSQSDTRLKDPRTVLTVDREVTVLFMRIANNKTFHLMCHKEVLNSIVSESYSAL
jgi:hypothetical protein